ncbi:MAG: sporulation protein YqfD [Acetivibrionales bacterium]|jgi:similar to stage IV sporulation protein
MLLFRLWNYIRGYVIILVEGYFLEKFINICTHRQMLLWDIKMQKNCIMTLSISIKGFKMLRPVAKKTGCRVRIIKKKGMPFILNRYKKRKTFVLGAVVFIILVYLLTSFIWAVEIMGNTVLETAIIREKLITLGIKPGVLKYKIDPDHIVNELMLSIEELSWASVTVKGTKVKVHIAERKKPPQLIPKNVPCNIVARRDGIVKSVIIKNGQEMVKAGDTVSKGQILVSGAVDIRNEEERKRLVHAIATVKARTWYESEWPVSMKITEELRTGRIKEVYYLEILAKRIKLFSGKSEFQNFEKVEIEKRVSIGEDLVFPLALLIERYYENNLFERVINEQTAKQLAASNAYKKVLNSIPEGAEIIAKDLAFIRKSNGGIVAKVTIECLEDIGVEQKIGGE